MPIWQFSSGKSRLVHFKEQIITQQEVHVEKIWFVKRTRTLLVGATKLENRQIGTVIKILKNITSLADNYLLMNSAEPLNSTKEGRDSGLVVSILAFYSDDPSSNPADN